MLRPLKTLSGWHDSKQSFSAYVKPGDRVDDAIHDQFLEVVFPVYFSSSMLQVGEAAGHVDGRATYTTFVRDSGGWTYVGDCHYRQITPPLP